MPTPTKGPRLGGSPAHERLILANLATSLFEHGRITTTEAKAKRLRPLAEKLITIAKRGDLHARREVMKVIRDKDVVHKLFAEIGPIFATATGGYTRIIKTLPAQGRQRPDGDHRAGRAQKTRRRRRPTGPAARQGRPSQQAPTGRLHARSPRTLRPSRRGRGGGRGRRRGGEVEESTSTDEAPYGEGSHAPLDDADEARRASTIKGNADSMLYHVPGTSFYDRTRRRGVVRRRPRPPRRPASAAAVAAGRRDESGASPTRPTLDRARRPPRTAGSVVFGSTSPTTAPTSPAGRASPAGAPCRGARPRRCACGCARRSR